jgi:carbon storage regulator
MLVLSRKVGEKLMIGDQITIVVSRVAGNRVTLGIEAPLEVPVLRAEIAAPVKAPHVDADVPLDASDCRRGAVPTLAE